MTQVWSLAMELLHAADVAKFHLIYQYILICSFAHYCFLHLISLFWIFLFSWWSFCSSSPNQICGGMYFGGKCGPFNPSSILLSISLLFFTLHFSVLSREILQYYFQIQYFSLIATNLNLFNLLSFYYSQVLYFLFPGVLH